MENEVVTGSDIYRFDHAPEAGSPTGRIRPTGVRPTFTDRLKEAGITLPSELYGSHLASVNTRW